MDCGDRGYTELWLIITGPQFLKSTYKEETFRQLQLRKAKRSFKNNFDGIHFFHLSVLQSLNDLKTIWGS